MSIFDAMKADASSSKTSGVFSGGGVAGELLRTTNWSNNALGPAEILVVDDEQDARDLIATVLEEAGARVTTAASAAAALKVLASSPITVLVSDVGMPWEDGYSLAHRLRTDGSPTLRDLPALALTAYARAEDRQRALEAGFQEHASKPVDPDTLVRAVAALVARSRRRAAASSQ